MSQEYGTLQITLRGLAKELVDLIQQRWVADWSQQPPKVGVHFNYRDIAALPSYKNSLEELKKIPDLKDKYSEQALEKPLEAFLEAIVHSIPNPDLLEKAIDYWWKPFIQFIETPDVPIRLFVGLSNFKAERPEYRLDSETVIRFYENGSLQDAIEDSISIPPSEPFWHIRPPLHVIPGAIQVDFSLPANRDTLEYNADSHECIRRMIILSNALRLCTFGRLDVGPWIPICNPDFPVKGLPIITSSNDGKRSFEPEFSLDDAAWVRFQEIYRVLKMMQSEDENEKEAGRAVRRRFHSAISQFTQTFEQGYWESVVVSLVILMESLLTPNRQGGRMQLAIAASNLLGGMDLSQSKELFDNLFEIYRLRNDHVHGEPMTEDAWDSRILKIANNAGASAKTLEGGVREFAFEVMRDYARRTITAMLHLYYGGQRSPSDALTYDLHRMHLDPDLYKSILATSKCYSFNNRPPWPSSIKNP